MALALPTLDVRSSHLLQAAMDEYFFRVWEYQEDGEYPTRSAVKDEIETLVSAIQRRNSSEALVAAARADRAFMNGSTFRGPNQYSLEEGTRPIAFRQLEVLVHRARWQLNIEALRPPSRSDRVSSVVPAVFDALGERDGLLALKPEMIPATFNHDRYLFIGDYAVFPHPEIRGARELVADLWWLASHGADVRVAIDPNRVVRKEDTQDVALFDYWFGIRPTRADLDDLHMVGHTRHERRADQHDRFGSYPLVATDFWWHAEDATKILKVEETVPRSAYKDAGGLVCNRFLHSLRDTRGRGFVHVDGAIKAYPLATYEADIDTPNASKGSDPLYRKMWRIDGTPTTRPMNPGLRCSNAVRRATLIRFIGRSSSVILVRSSISTPTP
jgi:hypothetical protein